MKNNFYLKVLAVFMFCVVFSIGANAQNTFSKGDQNLNLGIGLGSTLGGTGYTTTIPPLSVSYEVGIKDELFDDRSSLGIGAYLGYAANKHEWIFDASKYGFDYNYLILGARGAVHYHLINNLDTYAGLMLGYNNISSKTFGNWGSTIGTATASGLTWSMFLGTRYYFKENMGAFAELGYGIAYLQLGVTFRF